MKTLDPFTLFRNGQDWRPNPSMDEGSFHVTNATLRIDTRSDEDDPRSGWDITADYEYGTGRTTAFGPTSPGVRDPSLDGATTMLVGFSICADTIACRPRDSSTSASSPADG